MTNFILNIYSTMIEMLLWVIVIGSALGGAVFGASSLNDNAGLGVFLGVIAGLLVGIVICLFFVGPLMLLVNIRDHLKKVSDNTSEISEDSMGIRIGIHHMGFDTRVGLDKPHE